MSSSIQYTNISVVHTKARPGSRSQDRNVNLKIAIDKENPSNPPTIVDNNNTVLFQWNTTNKKYEPLGSLKDNFPVTPDGLIQKTYEDIYNENKEMFEKNTTAVINKLSEDQKKKWFESNTYQPYTTWEERRRQTSAGISTNTGQSSVGLTEVNAEELNKGIQSIQGSVVNHGNYQYPSKMLPSMDKIKFTMYTYGVRKTNKEFAGLSKTRDFGKIDGSVTLGIQPRISDRNSVSWNDLTADALSLAAAGAASDLISGGAAEVTKILNKLENTYGAEKSNIQEYAKAWFAGKAASISGLTSRIGGVVLNPNLELLFDGPQLRPFDFTFQLSPRDEDEAKQVKQIIRFFKQGMAVQRTETELFLKAPNVFDIKYIYKKDQEHPGLNKIKRCALMSFNVDYTPLGSYMTFPDGTMTSYNITLSFKELEPVYADEYNVGSEKDETVRNVQIGY